MNEMINNEAVLLSVPEGQTAGPLLIILHGLTGYKEEKHLAALAESACAAGFTVLRPDLYGHGQGEGAFRDHTLQIWIKQIRSLVRGAAESGNYSGIFLCGHSQGALCALLAAAQEESAVSGVCAVAPALKIPEQARAGTLFGLSFDPENVPDEVSVWGKPLSGDYVRKAQAVSAEDAQAYKGPVLFVHSDADERVPLSVSEEAVSHFKNARLIVLHGDDHDFDRRPDLLARAVTAWLLEQKKDLSL